MKINNNIQALNAYRNLYQNQQATSKNLEKLSSGLRINRAADDAAGLAISEKMRSQIRGLKMAERNAMDGISLLQTSEGAMQEVHAMLQRMRELAVQGANDTNTDQDREEIQKEINQLLTEVDSIADKTEFNSRKLLNGESAILSNFSEGNNAANLTSEPKVTNSLLKSGTYGLSVMEPENGFIMKNIVQPAAGLNEKSDITFTDRNSANQLGTYTINVRNFNPEVPSAAIEVVGPDGLPRGEKVSEKVGEPGSSVSIGGLTIPLDTIDRSGTAKVSLEAAANFAVWQQDTESSKFSTIDFNKRITTINGKITHGGMEFKFDSSIKTSMPFFNDSERAGLDKAVELLSGMEAAGFPASDPEEIRSLIEEQVLQSYNGAAVRNVENYTDLSTPLKDTINTVINSLLGQQEIKDQIAAINEELNVTADEIKKFETEIERLENTEEIENLRRVEKELIEADNQLKLANEGVTTSQELFNRAEIELTEAEKYRDSLKADNENKDLAEEAVIKAVAAKEEANTDKNAKQSALEKAIIIQFDSIAEVTNKEVAASGLLAQLSVNLTELNSSNEIAVLLSTDLNKLNAELTALDNIFSDAASSVSGGTEFAIINNALAFQIGPNTNQNVLIDVPELNIVQLGIDNINVKTQQSANDAIFSIDAAIQEVSSIRSMLGAVQNRMEHTINNLQVTHENLTSSESRIRDADMALEMTEFTRNNILNQSATAMLAQANQLPQGVLQLLQ